MLAAARQLEIREPGLSFMIASPNRRITDLVRRQVDAASGKPTRLSVVQGQARELMRQACAAIVTSGTATLETALIGTPQIIVYKTSAATYWFARSVLTIRHIGLVNIVANRTVCPELIQQDATPDAMAAALGKLLDDTAERREMLAAYDEVRSLLGSGDAAVNAAEILLQADSS